MTTDIFFLGGRYERSGDRQGKFQGAGTEKGAVAPIEIGVTALFLCPIIITTIDIGIVIYYYKYITMRRRFFMGIVKQKNPKTGVVYV
jgi:hypothetical protein